MSTPARHRLSFFLLFFSGILFSAVLLPAKPLESTAEVTVSGRKILCHTSWKGIAGQAKIPPAVQEVSFSGGKAVQATAQVSGNYQGMEVSFAEPVDLKDVESITFDFRQTVMQGRDGRAAIIIYYDSRNGLIGNFPFGKDEWNRCTVPIDLRTLKSLAKQNTPVRGKVSRILISMFRNLNTKGQSIAVGNLKFNPKKSGDSRIAVSSYRYNARPTSGDEDGTWLTDGKINEKGQAFYRQYADEPDAVFDLGAIYWVRKITLSAVAVPTQNFSDVSVLASHDGKSWQNAAHFTNQNSSGRKQLYSLSGDKLTVLGRFIRLKLGRNRTDIPIHWGEVTFEGKLPSDGEIAELSRSLYNLGPAMPAISDADYAVLKDRTGLQMHISRKNGVISRLSKNGTVLLERIFNRYDLYGRGEKLLGSGSGYEDRVIGLKVSGGQAVVVTCNPALPGFCFRSVYAFVDGRLSRTLDIRAKADRPLILYTTQEAVLPQEIRQGGLYETWGSSHDLKHQFAEQVPFDYPADTGAVTIFESPGKDLTFLTYRHRYDGQYVQIGSGVVTVAGFGDKRTIFTATGWKVNDGIFAFGKGKKSGSVETRTIITGGGIIRAFDSYLAQPEVKDFRSSIRRPSWLKDIRMFIYQGWEGCWGDTGRDMVAYHDSLIREGLVQYLAMDSNYHWGDFITRGVNRNLFGGRLTVGELQERTRKIREAVPSAKIAQYTWLWSASKSSRVFRNHPDWFITRNAQNQEIIFFPGMGVNYYRLVGIPESADEIVKSITDFINCYDQDVWYLDGGGSPSSIDWPNMRIDTPAAYDNLYARIRKSIQSTNPERAIFFNNPENPLGDIGYLESFGGVMTTNWRDGATWMYKFKLWQRADRLVSPLYIYWLPGVDAAFRQYAVGTGLGLTFGGDADRRRDVATMQAQQQSRFSRLVNSNAQPNWRHNPKTQLEIMPLTFGPSGWLFMKNHDSKAFSGKIATDLKPLGISDGSRPVHIWNFTLRPHPTHKGLLGEKELEQNYRNSRWASDFIISPAYVSRTACRSRLEQTVSIAPDQLQLLYLTQSPALIYSVDNLRNQLWLDSTLGVTVSGTEAVGRTDLTVSSSRRNAEILVLVPAGSMPEQVLVNGRSTAIELMHQAGTSCLLVPISAGSSRIAVSWKPLASPALQAKLDVRTGCPGENLTLDCRLYPAGEQPVSLSIRNRGDLVWNQSFPAVSRTVTIPLPKGITGGQYQALLQSADGKVLTSSNFTLAAGTPAVGRQPGMKTVPYVSHDRQLPSPQKSDSGILVRSWKDCYQPESSRVSIDTGKLSIRTGSLPMYDNYMNFMGGALEVNLKRFVKVRLRGNFHTFADGPRHGIPSLHIRYDHPDCAIGMMFDFAGPAESYVSRTFAGTGRAVVNRKSPLPTWGTGKTPEKIGIISNFAVEEIPEEILWIDLEALGAPSDWSGRTLVSGICQNLTPDRWIEFTLLETRDSLPAASKAAKYYPLKGGTPAEARIYKVPNTEAVELDGVLKPDEWKNALVFTRFSRLDNPAQFPPATRMMLQRSGNMLYLAAELTETRPAGFTLDKNSKPWFNDGIEIYLGTFAGNRSYVQYVIAGAGMSYGAWYEAPGMGKKNRPLDRMRYKILHTGQKLYFEAAIPMEDLGPVSDKAIGFNLGRNRMNNGTCENYSLMPGRVYLNLSSAKLTFTESE